MFHVHGSTAPKPADLVDGWVWRRIRVPDGPPMNFALVAGPRSIVFRTRETGARLDRVVLATSPNFVPTDELPRSGEVVRVVRGTYSASVSEGLSVTLDVEALGTGPIHFQWVKDGSGVPGATSSELTVLAAGQEDRGTYSVSVSSGSTTIVSTPAFLEIVQSDLRISRMTMGADNRLTFEVSGGGSSGGEGTMEVYASSVLSDWSDLENSPDWKLIGTPQVTSGQVEIDDPGANGETERFYIIKSQ